MSRGKYIDDYINEHPECDLHKTEPVRIRGKTVDVPVYSLPFFEQKLLIYNRENGRIKIWVDDIEKRTGSKLDMTNVDDAKTIQNLLIKQGKQDETEFNDDLKEFGQMRNAVCTHEGRVINGNRRMAGLQTLSEDNPNRKDFGFLKVGRLPEDADEDDIYKIELGIQMGRRVQLDYSATNSLLKFKAGQDRGISLQAMADVLYGGFTDDELVVKMQQLQQIESYTAWLGDPGNYLPIEEQKITEHFKDCVDILKKADDAGYAFKQQEKIQQILFQLIHDGEPQRSLRDVGKTFGDPEIFDEMMSGEEHSKPGNKEKKAKDKQDAKTNDTVTPTRVILDNVRESIKNKKLEREPEKLLEKARKILRGVDTESSHLRTTKVKDVFNEVYKLIAGIKNALEK